MPRGVHRGHWKPVTVEPDKDGCWIVVSHRPGGSGYPHVVRDGLYLDLHRYIFELFHGSLLPGEVVRHACDKPMCVNPFCLQRGAPLDNSADMVRRGRSARGSRHHKARLTDIAVQAIRSADPAFSNSALGDWFGVSKEMVGKVRRGESWLHVE
jgi:hypothetical protein